MSENIRGIRYEVSQPKQSPYDGYYYQRVRQVDERGNLVGIGEQVLRSARQDSDDGLVGRSIDLDKLGFAIGHALQIFLGPRAAGSGGLNLAADLISGFNEDYRSWPGTESPWERPFDWRTGSSPTKFVQRPVPGAIGDGNGIGHWSNASANFPPKRPPIYEWADTGDGFANVLVPNLSPPRPKSPAWNDAFVRDSAAAAGIPSRNNVFEYGFPESGSSLPLLMTPGATRGAGFVGDAVAPPVPFIPAAPKSGLGGLPGMIAEAGLNDPRNSDAPPAGGLVGLIQEYLRGSSR